MASQPLKVLFHLHPELDTLDFVGPYEILSHATFTPKDSSSDVQKAFQNTITAVTPQITTDQNLTLSRHIPITEVYATLADYDILIIPGGGSPGVLNGKTEPLYLIAAFAALPKRKDGRTRYILSVCTGSLFLAEAGVLDGFVLFPYNITFFFVWELRRRELS